MLAPFFCEDDEDTPVFWTSFPHEPVFETRNPGQRSRLGGSVKRPRLIVYWGFAIDIVGPKFERKEERQAIRKVLSRKQLRAIERSALMAVKSKVPTGFSATVS